jgi:hypothetical protein
LIHVLKVSSTLISAMPRKQKSTISCIQNLQGGGDTSSCKQQKSTEPDLDLSDRDEEIKLEDNAVCLKSVGILDLISE